MNTETNSKILVVDDTRITRKILDTMLKGVGYEVVFATDGEEAISQALAEDPDIILMDVNMPKMNGFEAALEIKSNPESSNIPILFVTTRDEIEDKREAFQLGADDYILKPFNNEDLLVRIDRRLERQREEKDHETQARKETLSQLMITLAHHINNALAVMSGRLELSDPSNTEEMVVLRKNLHVQIRKISKVVDCIEEMSNASEISTVPYITSGGGMLDISDRLEEKLNEIK
ncbi:MAG: response regulator [Candidatus Electryonea clarkiae]|nr:response regulator [Candidatus Electryonea clarkiae]MDP8287319.1 response regulator [Candidatus Electryonea clarkiae]